MLGLQIGGKNYQKQKLLQKKKTSLADFKILNGLAKQIGCGQLRPHKTILGSPCLVRVLMKCGTLCKYFMKNKLSRDKMVLAFHYGGPK